MKAAQPLDLRGPSLHSCSRSSGRAPELHLARRALFQRGQLLARLVEHPRQLEVRRHRKPFVRRRLVGREGRKTEDTHSIAHLGRQVGEILDPIPVLLVDDPCGNEDIGARLHRMEPGCEIPGNHRRSLTLLGHPAGVLAFEIDRLEPDLLDPLVQTGGPGPPDRLLSWAARVLRAPHGLGFEREFYQPGARIGHIEGVIREDQTRNLAPGVQGDAGAVLQQERQEVVEEVALAVLKVAHVGGAAGDVGVEPLHTPEKPVLDLFPRFGRQTDGVGVGRLERRTPRARRHDITDRPGLGSRRHRAPFEGRAVGDGI